VEKENKRLMDIKKEKEREKEREIIEMFENPLEYEEK